MFFHHSWSSKFPVMSFLFPLKNFCLSEQVCCWWVILGFLLRMFLFPLYFWSIFLLDIEFKVNILFFKHWKKCTLPGLHGFWWDPHSCLHCSSSAYNTTVFPGWFKEFFFLPLVCRSLIMVYLDMDFFEFVLFGIYELLKSVSLFLPNLGFLQPLILQANFYTTLYPLILEFW